MNEVQFTFLPLSVSIYLSRSIQPPPGCHDLFTQAHSHVPSRQKKAGYQNRFLYFLLNLSLMSTTRRILMKKAKEQ